MTFILSLLLANAFAAPNIMTPCRLIAEEEVRYDFEIAYPEVEAVTVVTPFENKTPDTEAMFDITASGPLGDQTAEQNWRVGTRVINGACQAVSWELIRDEIH